MSGQPLLNLVERQQSPLFDSGSVGAFLQSPGGSGISQEAWLSPHRLTLSFAPDGTRVSSYRSSLFQSFQDLMSLPDLERTITDGIQSWIGRSNLNIGFVDDSGDAFGVSGLSQGDERFGDIRVAAIPLGDEVYAVATAIDRGVVGTWAGDILFNANAKFNSVDHFYAVFVHELGHALGLAHSSGPNDIMNPAAFSLSQSANDIDALQKVYGVRQLDQYDGLVADDRNDTLANATRIKNPGSFKGTVPLIVYGDIESVTDADYYELRPLNEYSGTVTFRVVSDGISLLAPQITVQNEQGRVLFNRSSRSTVGDDLTVTLPALADESLFVRIRSSRISNRQPGSYSMVATFDGTVNYDRALVETVLRQDYSQLKQSDIHTLFTEPAPRFNDDLHTNDSLATATDLEQLPGSLSAARYRVQAGISDAIDKDYYRFTTPEFANGAGTITASLVSMEQLGLVARMRFHNDSFQVLQKRVIARGDGRYILQVDGVQGNSDYYVSVIADRPGKGFDTGNYSLDLSFGNDPYVLDVLGSGELSNSNRKLQHALYVAETQMFHLGIQASRNPLLSTGIVWMTIHNKAGRVVWRGATRPGEFRSANSVVLKPGSYSIQIELAFPPGWIPAGNGFVLNYQIQGKNVSDPMGPELINPANMPFPHCSPTSPEFCYPGDIHTVDPFILVNGGDVTIPPGTPPPPPLDDLNLWYWYQNWQNGSQG